MTAKALAEAEQISHPPGLEQKSNLHTAEVAAAPLAATRLSVDNPHSKEQCPPPLLAPLFGEEERSALVSNPSSNLELAAPWSSLIPALPSNSENKTILAHSFSNSVSSISRTSESPKPLELYPDSSFLSSTSSPPNEFVYPSSSLKATSQLKLNIQDPLSEDWNYKDWDFSFGEPMNLDFSVPPPPPGLTIERQNSQSKVILRSANTRSNSSGNFEMATFSIKKLYPFRQAAKTVVIVRRKVYAKIEQLCVVDQNR